VVMFGKVCGESVDWIVFFLSVFFDGVCSCFFVRATCGAGAGGGMNWDGLRGGVA